MSTSPQISDAADLTSEKPVIARPDGCAARADEDLMICDRCGLEWPAGMRGPKCNPITFEVLRMRMVSEIARAEASLIAVHAVRLNGGPADPTQARRRLAELEAIHRFVDRCITDQRIKDLLNGKKDKAT